MNTAIVKQWLPFTWCVLECLLFSGILNGWLWMEHILIEEKYFLDECNFTSLSDVSLGSPEEADMPGLMNVKNLNKGDVQTTKNGRKCILKKVYKTLTMEEYAEYMARNRLADQKEELDTVVEKEEEIILYCTEQRDELNLIITLVLIICHILMLPIGVLFDQYGTSRTRIISM